MRRISGSKRGEVAEGCRKMQKKKKEELLNLYSSPITRRRMIWAGNVACMRQMQKVYEILVTEPEVKRPFGKQRHRWEV
jgi:hypothetical protein